MKKVLLHHRVRFLRDVAGYTASGLTQPTGTRWVTDAGIKPWKSFIKPTKNKTYSNKVGWDKRSVPNMFVKEYLDVQHILLDFRMESTS